MVCTCASYDHDLPVMAIHGRSPLLLAFRGPSLCLVVILLKVFKLWRGTRRELLHLIAWIGEWVNRSESNSIHCLQAFKSLCLMCFWNWQPELQIVFYLYISFLCCPCKCWVHFAVLTVPSLHKKWTKCCRFRKIQRQNHTSTNVSGHRC